MFGDVKEKRLSGKQIGSMLGPLGVKPEAMRVALHRLRKDGWITSEKQGREVLYSLSRSARRETISAYDQIYNSNPECREDWHVVLGLGDDFPVAGNAIVLSRDILLMPRSAGVSEASLPVHIETSDIPAWFENRLADASTRREATLISEACDVEVTSPTIRLLMLHRWRRLALRNTSWAHMSFFPDRELARCQEKVTAWLAESPILRSDSQ